MQLIDGTSAILIISLHSLLVLITVFFTFIALLHNPKSITNRALAAMMATIALWGLFNVLIYAAPNTKLALALLGTQLSFAVMQTFAALFFIWVFPADEFHPTKKQKWIIAGCFVALVLAVSMSWSLFLTSTTNFYPGTAVPYTSPHLPFLPIWATILTTGIVWSIVLAVKKYRRAAPKDKGAYASILYGSTLTFVILIVTQFFVVNIFNTITFNLYGPLFVAPLIFGTGYAVVRYHLFSIKAVASEIFTLSLWLFLALRIFFEATVVNAVVDVVVLFGAVVIGFFLIKSVLNEVKQKEQLSTLNVKLDKTNSDLKDLSEHLQEKVDEQTAEIRTSYEVERKARIELEQLDKNKDQFIVATQEQLRTPLTTIKGYLQSLLSSPPQELVPQTQTTLGRVNVATDRLSSLIDDLLGISQMQVGKSVLNKQEVNPKLMIEEILSDMDEELQKKKITKALDLQEAKLQLDQVRMKEALTNLIDNAIKYCNDGGTITIKGEKADNLYRLTIQDTGIGLTEPEVEHAFVQYFERGEEAEKLNKTGRGIGLVVTKNIVDAHGGNISVQSEGRNKGSKFTIELPLVS